MLGEYGHVMSGPEVLEPRFEAPDRMMLDESWRNSPDVGREIGKVGQRFGGQPHIFPTLWFSPHVMEFNQRVLRGPTQTEMWWFAAGHLKRLVNFLDARSTGLLD